METKNQNLIEAADRMEATLIDLMSALRAAAGVCRARDLNEPEQDAYYAARDALRAYQLERTHTDWQGNKQ